MTSDKSVSFSNSLTVIEFGIILGDNPSCSSGAPVTIGWEPQEISTKSLDIFEFVRQGERRSGRKQLIIPVEERGDLLLNAGYSINQIAKAAIQVDVTQAERRETLRKLGWDKNFGMFFENTGKIPRSVMKNVLGATGAGKLFGGLGRRMSQLGINTKPKVVGPHAA